ncbi:MAG: UDP-N-acetylmuramoyl-L-alanyl-D-glutamate--2,6-diaminopimelate ligase [Candidatus Vogelbacteria bacterium]|nr:UDP-N-acetylmuramoyl-L-alanyl-D-glutamate--2,6-diaminopimelate ligase [Candidatus Vogelbacteria bacterium]
MKSKVKKLIKQITPQFILSFYHLTLAWLASIYYRNPSKSMIIIGITGTKGKSSVASFIWSCLEGAGYKTGVTSTAVIKIGKEEFPNTYHMTMPGRFALQKLLSRMYKAGCKFAIVETTSEGLKQWRHVGINYDFVIFTNLYPEHLPSHNDSMEEYKKAKGKLFDYLMKTGAAKNLGGNRVPKTAIVNNDSRDKDFFLSFPAEKKITYGIKSGDISASEIISNENGSIFKTGNSKFAITIPGEFNIENALPAIAICRSLGISENKIAQGLLNLKTIPGRMETINRGQPFKVYVDYAHQKESMEALLKTGRKMVIKTNGRVIVLLGAEGGGRDKAKRPAMGMLAGALADYVVVSNVDPYDDDPQEIIEDIAKASEGEGKIRNKDLFCIEDRREGIRKALSMAQPNDVVLITGKGSEQSIIIGGKTYPWDDRNVVKEELIKLNDKNNQSKN